MRSVTPSRCGADDWTCTSINRFTKPVPSYSATSAKQECKESNPAGRFWRPLASQKHTPVVKGYTTGVEPVLPASQAGVRTTYTTDTMLFVSGRRGSRILKAAKPTGFQPGPVANRVALPLHSAARPGFEPGTSR